jgi:hypothetical protein
MFDLEVVTLSLIAEFMSIDIENSLLKLVNFSQIPNLIEEGSLIKEEENCFCFQKKLGQN